MRWIERVNARFWERVSISTAPVLQGLGILRILSGAFLLLFAAPYSSWIDSVPPGFFNPPALSVTRLLPGFPPPPVLIVLDVVALALACCMMLGIRARATTVGVVLSNVLGLSYVYSFGKIDHDILLWVFLACMAFSGWGRSLALVPDRESRFDAPERSFALLGVLLAFAMSSVGFQKALSWLDFDLGTGGFLSWFLYGYLEYGRRELLAPLVYELPWSSFELLDYTAVVFELGCMFALLRGRVAWKFWLAAVGGFHTINTLVLNIPFIPYWPVYLAFVDFSRVQQAVERSWNLGWVRIGLVSFVAVLGSAHVWLRIRGSGSAFLLVVDRVRDNRIVLYASLALWVVATTILLAELRLALRRRRAAAPNLAT